MVAIGDARQSGQFRIGGELPVHRLGFGAMRRGGARFLPVERGVRVRHAAASRRRTPLGPGTAARRRVRVGPVLGASAGALGRRAVPECLEAFGLAPGRPGGGGRVRSRRTVGGRAVRRSRAPRVRRDAPRRSCVVRGGVAVRRGLRGRTRRAGSVRAVLARRRRVRWPWWVRRARRGGGMLRFRAHAPPVSSRPDRLPVRGPPSVRSTGRRRVSVRPGARIPVRTERHPRARCAADVVPPYVRVTLRVAPVDTGTSPRARGICPERPPTLR